MLSQLNPYIFTQHTKLFFSCGHMTSSQRQALITLIEKKGRDKWSLKNWRPISLINVDAKIASKALAI